MEDLSLVSCLFIQSFIYLYLYGLIDIYFILWFINQYYQYIILLLKLFQLGHWGLFHLAPVSL